MDVPKVDIKDKKILWLLSKNAREPVSVIAKKVLLSKDAVNYRIKRLKTVGIIENIIPMVEITLAGFRAYQLFINILADEEKEKQLIRYLLEHPFVMNLYQMSGRFSINVIIGAKNIMHFNEILDEILDKYNTIITEFDTNVSARLWKLNYLPEFYGKNLGVESNFKPADYSKVDFLHPPELDYIDKAILRLMSKDATTPIITIAEKIGTSSQVVLYHITKLLHNGVIERFAPIINYQKLGYFSYYLLIDLNSYEKQNLETLRKYLLSDDQIIYAYKTIGKMRIFVVRLVKDPIEIDSTIRNLKLKFPNFIKNIDHLLVKEAYKDCLYPEGFSN